MLLLVNTVLVPSIVGKVSLMAAAGRIFVTIDGDAVFDNAMVCPLVTDADELTGPFVDSADDVAGHNIDKGNTDPVPRTSLEALSVLFSTNGVPPIAEKTLVMLGAIAISSQSCRRT